MNAVILIGTKATRPDFLEKAASSVLDSKTVADVVNSSQEVAERLLRLDIFEDVQVLLDRANDPLAAPDSINVVYRVKEKGRLYIKTGTEIGNNEGNMVWTTTTTTTQRGLFFFYAHDDVLYRTDRLHCVMCLAVRKC